MIPLVKTFLPPKSILMPRLEEILYSGYIAQGAAVDEFEAEFKKYIGEGYSLSVNSGTAALHIALILAGVSSGDEVISTALTAEPTNVAIKMQGAKVRWTDIDPNTGSISAHSLEQAITEKTKAIIVVDYAGIPVDIDAIKSIADKYSIPVIEDAAHALGAKYDGKLLGNHFDFTVYSFQAIKHMTTVDGGMLQIKNKELYEKAKKIRWFGLDKSKSRALNDITIQGYKYHMNNVNATIGLVQLEMLDNIIDSYISNGRFFDRALSNISGIEMLKYYDKSEPSYWLYTMKVERKEDFIKMMESNGVMASSLHKRNDTHTYLNDFTTNLPCLDAFYEKMIHIPCGWWVNDIDREKIASCIKKGW